MGDSYRPRRPDRNRPPPLIDRMTFTAGGGDNYRPGEQKRRHQNGGRSANLSEFTFSTGQQAPQFPPAGPADADSHGARRKRNRGGASGHNSQRGGYSLPTRPAGRQSANGQRRGGFRKLIPHERALLQSRDDSTEHTLGVLEGPNKFRNLEDLSDDEQAEMDVDTDQSNDSAAVDGQNGTHKAARLQSSVRGDGDSVPKWSNPDPYTVLPPPEETTGKRRDFVQFIRKAKNQIAEKSNANNAVAANDDFISFGDDDEDDEDDEDMKPAIEDEGPPVAPWARPSSGAQPFRGSLNEVAATGALPVPGHKAKRSAEAAGFPEKPQHPGNALKRKRGELEGSLGGLVELWQLRPRSHPTPWATDRRNLRFASEPYKWLHNEILDFCDYVAPLDHENQIRRILIDRIQTAIGRKQFAPHSGKVLCFGSFPAGLYLPTADMDLVYASDQHVQGGPPVIDCSKQGMWKVARKLEHRGIATNIQVIAKAKVPIIKFMDRVTGIQVDLSFENLGGVHAQTTFQQWRHDYPDMAYLVVLVKQFLVMRGLNEVNTGGLGGFSIICLVVSFIQLQPKPDNLGELFLNFLDYYGNRFDLSRKRIIMHPPAVVDKGEIGIDGRPERPDGLSIQDPNRPDNNISGGSHQAKQVFTAFANAHKALSERLTAVRNARTSDSSILEPLLAGDYSSYERQRKRMRTVK